MAETERLTASKNKLKNYPTDVPVDVLTRILISWY